MKRKIAILLSAMMVASAMPMTASAVQLKSDTIINAGFGKVGATIDAKADQYKTYNTVDQLKSRESVLKLVLNDDNTNGISKDDGSFKITLENGTFGDLSAGSSAVGTAFEYKNTSELPYMIKMKDSGGAQKFVAAKMAGGKVVSYASSSTNNKGSADQTTDGKSVEVKSLTGAFKVENQKVTGMIADDGSFVSVDELVKDTKVDELIKNLEFLIQQIGTTVTGNSSSNGTGIKSGDATEMNTMLKALSTDDLAGTGSAAGRAIDAVGTALTSIYSQEETRSEKILPHIPYTMTINSDNEATVTPQVDIPNEWTTDAYGNSIGVKSIVPRTTLDKALLSMEVYVAESPDDAQVKIASGNNVVKVCNGTNVGYVKLCPKTENKAVDDKTNGLLLANGVDFVSTEGGKPYFAIPLGGVKVNGDGPVKAKVTADYSTKVTGGEYTITKATGEGSTSLVYPSSSVKSFDESLTLDEVTIKENSRGTIGNVTDGTATFTLKVNSGFKFDNATSSNTLEGLTVTDASGRNKVTVESAKYVGDGQSTIEVSVSGLTDRTNVIGLSVKGLKIAPTNSKNYGDVELSVSGNGIDSKTITVAKREAIGFKLETAKDPKEIVAGRSYEKDTVNMSLADSQTVEVKFSEAVANSLISSRSLDFNLPEGVKIVDADLSEVRNINNLDKTDFEIINNGKTLRLKANSYTMNSNGGKNLGSFKIKFELSVAPDFAGDIKCNVTGGGQGADTKTETVIAKAIAPFKIETKNTKINLGYQDYNTADIVITEAKPGMFLANKEVVLGIKAPFKGGNTIGFSQAQYEVSGGELEVKDKDFKVENDVIKFKINRNSTKNPSTVTIKNVKIGTNRSVPFGSYDLTIGGDAVLNNYSEAKTGNTVNVSNEDNTYNVGSLSTAQKLQLANQDTTENFVVKDYVNVITETGTFNETVKVSVGEKTVVVGGQTLDMDVAPYIQASSNSTMVPLRFVAVALGVDSGNVANPDASSKVAWDQNSKTVTIYYGSGTNQKIIQFQAGSNIMTVDGTRIPMEYGVVAEIKEGRMFVPFRALGQALGVSVNWDPETRTAIYNQDNSRTADASATTTESTTASTTATTTESTTKKEDSTTSTTKAEDSTETTTTANAQ